MLWLVFALLLILAAVAYFAADTIETWIPGWKHTIVGGFTAVASGIASLATLLQGQDGAIVILLKNKPEVVPLVSLGLGLLILVLGWVTPRASD
jgi:hypothetical protein